MKRILIFLVFWTSVSVIAQDVTQIKWEDLIPSGLDFDDPFMEYSEDQLYDLDYVYRTRMLIKNRPDIVKEQTRSKVDSIEKQLRSQGMDIEYLISIKDDIRTKRKRFYESVVPEMNGKNIRMAGFLLPLDFTDKAATDFLFVPYVGACIHEPTPPKNQLIYFQFPEGYKISKRFEAVWLEGQLLIESNESVLNLVDGANVIESGYSLNVSLIEDYYKD